MEKISFLNSYQKQQLLEKPNEIWSFINSSKLKPYYMENTEKEINIESNVSHSENHLHIIIKTEQTSLMNRDRAYQHGDGFHFVLAKPKENNERADEFFVIGISPLSDNWMKKFVWYQNIDLVMTPLEKTEVKIISLSDSTYIVVNIPFSEIYPIKGLINKYIGFNISYVQTLNKEKNIYILKEDNKIQSEQSLREYHIYEFEEPKNYHRSVYQLNLNTIHGTNEHNPHLQLGFYSYMSNKVKIKIKTCAIEIFKQTLKLNKGLNRFNLEVDLKYFRLGNNELTITIEIGDEINNQYLDFYLYNQNEFNKMKSKINELYENNNYLIKESISSLKFYYLNIMEKLIQLKPYKKIDSIIIMKIELEEKIKRLKMGQHLFVKGEALRLGFLSQIDATLQPYTLYIPKNTNSKTKPKLIVLLHGSGSDDTSINNNPFHFKLAEESSAIILAPYARGTSHFYCPKEARAEVIELTNKVANLFSIDEDSILLGGFSMGGYGVYRIFDDAPSLYKGLIIVSGHPSIGKFFEGIDYTKDENIIKFKDIPMIIFHGIEDRNCRFQEVKPFCEQIKRINKQALVVYKNGIGHSGINKEWYEILSKWIHQFHYHDKIKSDK